MNKKKLIRINGKINKFNGIKIFVKKEISIKNKNP